MKTAHPLSRAPRLRTWALALATLAAAPIAGFAQFTAPHITTTAGDETSTLGATTFVNHGLVGVGRISASAIDSFGESFGSVSGLQITNWSGSGTYTGTFNILPDRGYNSGNFYSHYAARIQQVNFSFTPHTGATGIGGADLSTKIAAQNQIQFTSAISGVKLSYLDPLTLALSATTGLDPGAGTATFLGKVLPYVMSYTGNQSPSSVATTIYNYINKLPLDSEAIAFRPDGSGYLGDEYAANIYFFNASKQIVGVITPPAAIQPHTPAGTLNFNALGSPANGRRNNQGMEGVALSPDGKTLFALLQSAMIQDSAAAQTRLNTRLLVYNVAANATPSAPAAEYALQLPTYTANGDGVTAVNATCAQSEIIALDANRILVLSRDGNGLGNPGTNPSVFKSVLLVDIRAAAAGGTPTNFAGTARDAEGGKITTAPGVLDPAITPVSWAEAVNMLNTTQLAKFNIDIDLGGASQVSKLTLGEKWEGMSLVSANDPAAPNDYFLFIANDNDFLTSTGKMIGPDGTLVTYNAFAAHPANRIPAAVGDATDPTANENDTIFLAYRVTITPAADTVPVTPVTPTPPAANQPPVVIVGKRKITASTVKISGSARDADGSVRLVEVKVNTAPYRKAKSTAKWSFTAELKPGKNTILVRATDNDDARSAPVKITVKLK